MLIILYNSFNQVFKLASFPLKTDSLLHCRLIVNRPLNSTLLSTRRVLISKLLQALIEYEISTGTHKTPLTIVRVEMITALAESFNYTVGIAC